MKQVNAKFGNMKKEESFVVYPKSADDHGTLRLQSGHRCVLINVETRSGMLSKYVANYPNFMHCNPGMGGTVVTVTKEFIAECQGAQPKSGDALGGGVYIA